MIVEAQANAALAIRSSKRCAKSPTNRSSHVVLDPTINAVRVLALRLWADQIIKCRNAAPAMVESAVRKIGTVIQRSHVLVGRPDQSRPDLPDDHL